MVMATVNGGDTRREVDARITKAEEEINLALRTLTGGNARTPSSSSPLVKETADLPRHHTRLSNSVPSSDRPRDCYLDGDNSTCAGPYCSRGRNSSHCQSSRSGVIATSQQRTSCLVKGSSLASIKERRRALEQRQQLSWVKYPHGHYPARPSVPSRLIHSMHALNDSSVFDETTPASSSSSSACSTLSISGKRPADRNRGDTAQRHGPTGACSMDLPADTIVSSTNSLQSAKTTRNGAATTTGPSLCSSVSAYELLDLTDSDSVIRWTSQILAELDSIADCSEIQEELESEEYQKKRNSFVVPPDAKQKLEEACAQLKGLENFSKSGGEIENDRTSNGDRIEPQFGPVSTGELDRGQFRRSPPSRAHQTDRGELAHGQLCVESAGEVDSSTLSKSNVERPSSSEQDGTVSDTANSTGLQCIEPGDPTQQTIANICPFASDTEKLETACSELTEMSTDGESTIQRRCGNGRISVEPVQSWQRYSVGSGGATVMDELSLHSIQRVTRATTSRTFHLEQEKESRRNSRSTAAHSTIQFPANGSVTDGRSSRIRSDSSEQWCSERRSTGLASNDTKTVSGVVESIIKQAESYLESKSTGTSRDRMAKMSKDECQPTWIRCSRASDYVELHDAYTQTTPISLSRSSSFTWISEADQQRPTSFAENRLSYDGDDASGTDTTGGSGGEHSSMSTPVTAEGAYANEEPVGNGDPRYAFDKSLSLSGLSRSGSSCMDLNKNNESGEYGYSRIVEDCTMVEDQHGASAAIQRRHGEQKGQKVDACETWPPTSSASTDPMLTESLRVLLETVTGPSGRNSMENKGASAMVVADSRTAHMGVSSLAVGRDFTRGLVSQSPQRHRPQSSWRAASGYSDEMEAARYKSGRASIPCQQHVHISYDTRRCACPRGFPYANESDHEGSVYDNVPPAVVASTKKRDENIRGQMVIGGRAAAGVSLSRPRQRFVSLTPDSPNDQSMVSDTSCPVNMQRDISVASGLLADSESSPVYVERGFAVLDGLRSDVATPDSVRSATSSDGGGAASTQPAPEFQYKSARDYMMDREAQIVNSPYSRLPHRCSATSTATTTTAETTAMGFVPKESVLRGETTRCMSPVSTARRPMDTGTSSYEPCGENTQGSGSDLSLAMSCGDTKSALANSLPALDRLLLDCHSFTNTGARMVAPVAVAGSNSKQLTVTDTEAAKQSSAVFSSRKENAEAEARQCCFWLRAAGFPQYARMYEEGQFPIDIDAVQKDHEFLDPDSLQPLFRRLETLNRCASMKLGSAVQQSRKATASGSKADKDSEDEEDEIALSRRWRFVRKSRTWSRIGTELGVSADMGPTADGPFVSPMPTWSGPNGNSTNTTVQSSIADKFQDCPTSSVKLRSGSLRERDADVNEGAVNDRQPQQQRLRRSQSERLRDKAKALVRRMELMRNGRLMRRRSPSLRRNGVEPEISNPVLIQHFSVSPAHMKLLKDPTESTSTACRPPTTLEVGQINANSGHNRQAAVSVKNTSRDERRRGRIFSSGSGENSVELFTQLTDAGPLDGTGASHTRAVAGPTGASNRQQWSKLAQERVERKPCPESDSSPETQTKSGSSSLRVQVDVEVRANTFPPLSHSSFDSSDADHSPQCWERRDSGVGSSLSRSPSAPARPRVRWHSFQKRHGIPAASVRSGESPTSVDHLTAPQMITVQKYALLKLTALMEKYSPSYKSSGWSWGVQKLLRRMKASESKVYKDRQVFGVPLTVVAQRTGQPLPQCILHAMRYLRKQAVDNVGLFRKSGVRSRIQKLRQLCEASIDLPMFESQQAYDVADMLKQYFRELPEPLLTSKLSETFVAIYLHVPDHLRIEAMQKLVLLLPDENREVLLSLLYFLRDVAAHSDKNQMNIQNISVCFAPTLFQLSGRNTALSPTQRHKTITTPTGLPSEAELMENRAAQICLVSMIANCKKIFSVPQDLLMKCAHTVADLHEPANLSELGHPYGNYNTYLAGCVESIMKEHRERWRGWVTEGCIDGVEITSKKANDEYPLKLWRCWVDVEAPPRELLHRILRERDAWDDDIIKWRVVRKQSDNCEVFQYVVNDMPPHPTRDYCVVRLWLSDVPELRGGCVLVQTSVNVQEAPMLGGVRGVCLASRYLIEPSGGGKSRITHVDRVDTRGRSKTWYNKVFGYLVASQLARLRDSFKQIADGPETKV